MLRGSRPGERRGGRKRHTPNRRTILIDRILSVGSDHPMASQRAFLLELVKDPKLPADIRMDVAPRCFPAKRTFRTGRRQASTNIRSTPARGPMTKANSAAASESSQIPNVLAAWLGVVQDRTADPKARRRAALKIAEFLLPKVAKKAIVLPDKYGFMVSPKLARAYRDIQIELQFLVTKGRTDPQDLGHRGKDQKIGGAFGRDPPAAASAVARGV
jgi:hypothetical protein